jgi:hypothetical protein
MNGWSNDILGAVKTRNLNVRKKGKEDQRGPGCLVIKQAARSVSVCVTSSLPLFVPSLRMQRSKHPATPFTCGAPEFPELLDQWGVGAGFGLGRSVTKGRISEIKAERRTEDSRGLMLKFSS